MGNSSTTKMQMSQVLASYIEGLGFRRIQSHMVYVHATLTREIIVYEKT